MRLTAICNGLKWTIFASGEVELLQIVLKPDTEWCAREDAWPSRGVDCEIPHWMKMRTKHSLEGCGNLSLIDVF